MDKPYLVSTKSGQRQQLRINQTEFQVDQPRRVRDERVSLHQGIEVEDAIEVPEDNGVRFHRRREEMEETRATVFFSAITGGKAECQLGVEGA